MDAIVLAGGYATRLWPVTRHRPKMLLPLGERTVLDRLLAELEAESRIDDVFVSTNAQFETLIRNHLAETDFEKPQVSVESTTGEDEKLGVIAALAQLVEREALDDDTLVVGGDNVLGLSLARFCDQFEAHGGPTLAAYDVGTPAAASSYGVLETAAPAGQTDGGSDTAAATPTDSDAEVGGDTSLEVTTFAEKPDDPSSSLVSVACYGFPAELLSKFDAYLAAGNNPDEPGWFVKWLVEETPETVQAVPFDDAWFDVGTPESYLNAVAWALDGDSYVHPEAAIGDDVTLGSNVHVMADAEITDSSLERTVVFPEATIADSELERTLVDTGAELESVALSESVIGAYTRLGGAGGRPG
ncbi:sugar nucleotidyltransferase [Natronomonas pharaonis DSM 2160]|uniref:Bifunctional protein GlmU n=1 Tax=Natronomonas pharaonis (strain ATCC 35678 / DSM 2160 / CIP 103997 / JCM 8858 / NBRC 14720 / NCIMB 2260 / Gabara) TaxID=348780 RepID=A0A1U7EYW7_NATPD|nr:NDP-sugar synthase [Natronomonas pharaonis]CAI50431.1 sugar nucleotidyltransferase [Natronomonas pharaonis DSM 2160]